MSFYYPLFEKDDSVKIMYPKNLTCFDTLINNTMEHYSLS